MNRKKLTALLLSSIMAVTPAMPAMADQSTVSDYVEATADDVSDDTSDDTTIAPAPLPDPTVKSGWETVDGVKYYYENGEKVVNKAKKRRINCFLAFSRAMAKVQSKFPSW